MRTRTGTIKHWVVVGLSVAALAVATVLPVAAGESDADQPRTASPLHVTVEDTDTHQFQHRGRERP